MTVAGVVAALDREARVLGPAREARAGFEILAGGTLQFTMQATANKQWGEGKDARPAAMSVYGP